MHPRSPASDQARAGRSARARLVEVDDAGLRVGRGGFHIDPWKPVPCAVVTHAHSDHARAGSGRIIASKSSLPLLRRRLGPAAPLEGVEFGERFRLGDATVSLHPAGHVLGSVQVRIECDGETWVVTGDYKRDPDPTCEPFEVVPCDVLITEATFALPIYAWPPIHEVMDEILRWWSGCAAAGRTAILCCYALGKAQRVLGELAPRAAGPEHLPVHFPVYLHGAMIDLVQCYRDAGIAMIETVPASALKDVDATRGRLVLAPPSAVQTPWIRRFAEPSIGFASGWMQVRGVRRRRAMDAGFVLSDHADWAGLLRTIDDSGCREVLTTHGYGDALVRYLRERGMTADVLRTEYRGEDGDPGEDAAE